MKLTVTMKTPDALERAVEEAVPPDEPHRPEVIDSLLALCARWFVRDEYVTLQIDTDRQTCAVLEA
jgi:hypothetical protein